MDKETLKKANEISQKIIEHECALGCFYFDVNQYSDVAVPPEYISTNPQLIIEFDDCEGGREQQKIPMVLSDYLISMLKDAIKSNLDKLKSEFTEF